ncbi:hypothetical protein EZS27_029389 [termite gut metagenome]|uniref:Uncharacterized protein n=1 Tax=termite gut metagenome TaxID=433724 RepID=A0A5J4QJ24_9ZZZZ
MGLLKENLFLINSKGEEIEVDDLFNSFDDDSDRVLANDEIGVILYTADLDLFSLDVTSNGRLIPKKVNQISRSRFGASMVRLQIGGKIASYSADTIFHVQQDDYVIKVRADKIKTGMILSTGEKVY